MAVITNPILPGFNPDPSICRAGDDFYIATSTFEWFPGVQIHHSKDLVNWELLTRPLDRVSQLDMWGDPDSGGIWAPCLSYHDGLFYLIYTDVKAKVFSFLDSHNYLVTAPDIEGPWSDPVYLNSSGFDPSLFHDDDGRKWLVNMQWDFRGAPPGGKFNGILLQEFSVEEQRLVGPVTNIFKGSGLGATEGPHLYKRDGRYYLMVAEGGTGYGHAETMARSRTLTGPYELDPVTPIITAKGTPKDKLQKAGHASIVDTPAGDWYMVHLCGRPVGPKHRCILGRETAIQPCYWTDDGWLRVTDGAPLTEVPAPGLPPHRFVPVAERQTFDTSGLDINFQALRRPFDESWCSLTERPGFLRLKGRESLTSLFDQSMVARRLQAFNAVFSTQVEFEPETFQHMAGLVCYYDIRKWYYLHITQDETLGRIVRISGNADKEFTWQMGEPAVLPDGPVVLQAAFKGESLQFSWAPAGGKLQKIGPVLDATILSDDYLGGFTGAFAGMCCQDLASREAFADFEWFEYKENV